MAHFVFANARLFDGTGKAPQPNSVVVVEGQRITKVVDGESADTFDSREHESAQVVDVGGRTLMPGLIESHMHISYWGVRELADLDLKLSAEISTIYATKNAELALRCGYTSAASAGALHRVDVVLRDAIDQGLVPGPRLLAAGRDICPTSGMLDWNPSFWELGMEGLAIFADGPSEVRKAVRSIVKEGADVIKLYVTGEGVDKPGVAREETMMTRDEVMVAVDEAHRRKRQVAAHVRGDDGVRMCVEAGVDVIEHATFAGPETIRLMASQKDRLFVVPGLGYHWGVLRNGRRCGFPDPPRALPHYVEEFEVGCRSARELHESGVRVLPGGDYGFVWCPHGEYAKDLELFVDHIGMSASDTLVAATRYGAELMGRGHDLGTIEEGKLADILVVDGDPLSDITVLQDRSRLSLVMKDGRVMVNTFGMRQELSHLEDYTMNSERLQNERAAGDEMPTAALVQH